MRLTFSTHNPPRFTDTRERNLIIAEFDDETLIWDTWREVFRVMTPNDGYTLLHAPRGFWSIIVGDISC